MGSHDGNFSQDKDGDMTLFDQDMPRRTLRHILFDLFTPKSPPLTGTCYLEGCSRFTGEFPYVYNNPAEGKNYYRCPECGGLVNDGIVHKYLNSGHQIIDF